MNVLTYLHRSWELEGDGDPSAPVSWRHHYMDSWWP